MKIKKIIYPAALLTATAYLFIPDYNPHEKIITDFSDLSKPSIAYKDPVLDTITQVKNDSMANLELDKTTREKGLKSRYISPIYMLPNKLLE